MKRLFALMTALVCLSLCVPVASANEPEGVFVPNYKTFMESLIEQVESIDSGLANAIREDCFVDGEWGSPSDSINRVWYWEIAPELRLYERSDYLSSLYITIEKEEMAENEDIFKQLIVAAATSIIPDADVAFEKALFENLYYEYVKDSPAGYITMYWNCGVYLFQFNKSSGEYSFQISLSLYEAE